jgi:flagellar basal body rod protein FlgC
MLKCAIEANSVTLNGRKYGKLLKNLQPNIKPTIFGMAVKVDNALPNDYDFIMQYEPPKPQTNADRIRAMSDEELAEWLNERQAKTWYYGTWSKDAWLDWLKQEETCE